MKQTSLGQENNRNERIHQLRKHYCRHSLGHRTRHQERNDRLDRRWNNDPDKHLVTNTLEGERQKTELHHHRLPRACGSMDNAEIRMRKYLKEIEISGVILMLMGCFIRWDWTIWLCAVGIFLWLIPLVYKAFHWEEYRRDNILNIAIMAGAIIVISIFMMVVR